MEEAREKERLEKEEQLKKMERKAEKKERRRRRKLRKEQKAAAAAEAEGQQTSEKGEVEQTTSQDVDDGDSNVQDQIPSPADSNEASTPKSDDETSPSKEEDRAVDPIIDSGDSENVEIPDMDDQPKTATVEEPEEEDSKPEEATGKET